MYTFVRPKRKKETQTHNYKTNMVDIFARLEKNAGGPIGQYMSYAHGYYAFPKLEGDIGPHMVFRGKKMLNWSLNNYLGLANHPEVRKADAEGAAQFGMAAPMWSSTMPRRTPASSTDCACTRANASFSVITTWSRCACSCSMPRIWPRSRTAACW